MFEEKILKEIEKILKEIEKINKLANIYQIRGLQDSYIKLNEIKKDVEKYGLKNGIRLIDNMEFEIKIAKNEIKNIKGMY